jgi:ATP-dependent Lhr-like helicase
MTASPASGSEERGPRASVSRAFDSLHERVRRWIWEQGWTELRDAQEAAIPLLLEGCADVIVSAATAGGKTEAAFLPIVSRLATGCVSPGIGALYVGPMKALINDQFRRLEDLCEDLGIAVHRWHGDVDGGRKRRVVEAPSGILLITPESLEALFVLRGPDVPRIFAGLGHVVVDELHSFIGSERGRQLQALLHRLELALRRRVPRVGLSATLGDLGLAAEFLRPGRGTEVIQITSQAAGQEIRIQVRGYEHAAPRLSSKAAEIAEVQGEEVGLMDVSTGDQVAIAEHLFVKLRGADNLVFANSRAQVERYADLLREMSDRARVPNEFLPHHGSLAKDLRQEVEARLKDRSVPVTAICTSTLEMGIDIGSVRSVAQIDPPLSVAALRQRLGRSGRRNDPAVLRVYIREAGISPNSPPEDCLRTSLVQAIAVIELLLAKWCEPPESGALHLSTLVQQLLSLIAQHGGVQAADAWEALCRSGPFRAVDQPMFAAFLRGLARHDLLSQAEDGTLLLGVAGERLVGHYTFYAAFATPEEFRIVDGDRMLGTLPIASPIAEGSYVLFAGRRWHVTSLDPQRRIVFVTRARAGRAPHFNGAGGQIHDRVRREMRRVYCGGEVPVYLDDAARELLLEGRASFVRFGLLERSVVRDGTDVILLPWRGDRILDTLLLSFLGRGVAYDRSAHAIRLRDLDEAALAGHVRALLGGGPPEPRVLARAALNKESGKHDCFLPEDLLEADFAARALDLPGAWETLAELFRS